MAAHVLILVENLSVPFDRRVWQESQALAGAGFKVTVICPTGSDRDREREAVIDGVRILRYPLRGASGGARGYLREYSVALWHTLRLALKVRREGRIDIVQACNPPDLLFLVALVLRVGGTRFVFDHHDLWPEMFLSRFPNGARILHRLTQFCERLTFATADGVISTNESHKRVAIERGNVPEDRVVVVRNAPHSNRFTRRPPDPALRRGKRYLLAYLGVMGHQDGVDYALRALAHLRFGIGREDFRCVFMGAGDAFDEMVALSEQLGIADIIDFPGWVGDEFIERCLSTADICLAPDPPTEYNNRCSMVKIVEYMAMAQPIVSFDLFESRISASESAVYVGGTDVGAYAVAIDELLADPERRKQMGSAGQQRLERELSWDTARGNLVEFYYRLTGRAARQQDSSRL